MSRKTILSFVLCCVLLTGCKSDSSEAHAAGSPARSGAASVFGGSSDAPKNVRDNTPNVLVPSADGTDASGTDTVTVDASHTDQGYVMVRYTGNNKKVKLQITTPGETTYTYLLSREQEYETFPLPGGDGSYSLSILENVQDDMYSTAFSQELQVSIENEFLPFLYPNQYVFFTPQSEVVAKGSELAQGAGSDLEAVENIYHYVIQNITYDTAKAASVAYGYLPDVDETLQSGTGICFDYAAITAAMLRSQRIPTRLEIGYVGEQYHAWISVYLKESGWIDNIIEFNGSSWSLMDPTFAAGSSSRELKQFIGDGSDYVVKYYY